MPSFTDAERGALLAVCRAVVYTPQNEHFGIVPLEAMACARPVIACDSGGPLESIRPGVTGFLVKPGPDAFAAAMLSLMVQHPSLYSVI
jgi:alpha-1,3/alpha-1,6-mannosyltransferase